MTEPVLIAKENVPMLLQVVGQDIENVIDTFTMGNSSYHQVVTDLYNGSRQLWILATDEFQVQGWLVTKLQNLPAGKRLIFDLFGGKGIFADNDLDLLLTHLDKIEDWAAQYGVTETFGYMRPGLRKKLRKYGFHHVCDIVIRPLKQKVH